MIAWTISLVSSLTGIVISICMLVMLHTPVQAQSAAPSCAPAPFGQGTKAITGTNDHGAWAAWWCNDGYGAPTLRHYAVRWDALTPEMRADIASLSDSANVSIRIQLLADKYAKTPMSELRAVWVPGIERIKAAMPPAPVWKVSPYRANPTRPAYPFVAGVRGKTKELDVPHSIACDCAVRSVEGSSTYCKVASASGIEPVVVALCEKVVP